jgi:hypothetical protein
MSIQEQQLALDSRKADPADATAKRKSPK